MTDLDKITIVADCQGDRLDKYLASATNLPRAKIQKLISAGVVLLNGVICTEKDNKRPVSVGEVINITNLQLNQPSKLEPNPSLKFEIVYEDNDLLVINKPAGLTVHPGAGNYQNTLVNALLAYNKSLATGASPDRPGIVHRLDKDTSGLMVVAKTDNALNSLSAQLSDRSLSRTYMALVWGVAHPTKATFITQIARSRQNYEKMKVVETGGKSAITHYQLIENFSTLASLVEAKLETGRTHQIRVHFSHHGYPLIGDQTYGKTRKILNLPSTLSSTLASFKRQALHAKEIGFIHPSSGERMSFSAPPPSDFEALLSELRKI